MSLSLLCTCRFPNGDSYEGEWKANLMHGEGQMIYAGGGTYTGAFRCGMRHGKGTLSFANGDEYSGTWCEVSAQEVGAAVEP